MEVMQLRGVASNGVIGTFGASAGILQDAAIQQDLLAMIKRYRSLGYSRMSLRCAERGSSSRFRDQRLPRSASVDLWSTELNRHVCYRVIPIEKSVMSVGCSPLLIEVNEGKQTKINSVDFSPFDQSMDEQRSDEGTADARLKAQ